MKYGLIVYKETTNIGDDIQCYAAASLLPQVDVVIDREHLDEFKSEEPVMAIMNGWFLHKKWNWPPANDLRPLFVAFHYAEYRVAQYYGEYIKTEFLKGPGKDYLKAWEPIGCRDLNTVKLLENLGIKSYFSGCLTLTLPQMPRKAEDSEYICLVDLDVKATEKFSEKAKKENINVKIMTHLISQYKPDTTWEYRSKKVEELLTVYQNAKCVVTSRLHCALPCLALGVPVILVRKDLDNIRFQPYVEWLHTLTLEDARKGNIPCSLSSPPENKQKHLETRNQLINSVKSFLENQELTPKYQIDDIDRLVWQRDALRSALENNLEKYKFDILHYEKKTNELLKRLNSKNVKKTESNDNNEESLFYKIYKNITLYGAKTTWLKIKSNLRK